MMNKAKITATLAAILACASTGLASPYATTLVYSDGPFGNSPYDDPASVLGAPSTDFYDPWGGWSGGTNDRRVKMVEPAYNLDAAGNKLITTLRANSNGTDDSCIVVSFDHQVENDPLNPYGQDFLVFGNSFYVGGGTSGGFVNDGTDMGSYYLAGGCFSEPVLVSVSKGYQGLPGEVENDHTTWQWFTYADGPYGDTDFPTHAYHWDQAKYDTTGNGWTDTLMDFTKPVNPAYQQALLDGDEAWMAANTPYSVNGDGHLNVSEALALYEGSGGGTGFDLDVFGLDWIQYIKVEGTVDFREGEIDAFADVAVPEPATMCLLGLGGLGVILRRRRN
jgi:hypothetical protein